MRKHSLKWLRNFSVALAALTLLLSVVIEEYPYLQAANNPPIINVGAKSANQLSSKTTLLGNSLTRVSHSSTYSQRRF